MKKKEMDNRFKISKKYKNLVSETELEKYSTDFLLRFFGALLDFL